ncbi:hypothetical protein CRG98_020443 [Punica granatum]|uniref:Uncharacterized protein n=1 Tax=Punica granatum TaxID=22663 RepID=A0A2I0JS91_PUNGR|nr:hypothetical protein CRG98_020443 [Punica granatum]
MATGLGGIKAALLAHGADQLDQSNQRAVSAFFNWFFFSMSFGSLITYTAMVWVAENLEWNCVFKISLVALGFALFVFVFASAVRNRKALPTQVANACASERATPLQADKADNYRCRFLDKALVDNNVSASEVEETKTFIGLLPIFASAVMMNCCLVQLQTFTVQQGFIMDWTIRGFKIPTQSLSLFPLVIMLTGIFQPSRRFGLCLGLTSFSMATAALVKTRRRAEHVSSETTLSIFWLVWQYLLLGVSNMFTLGGMLEFFYSEAPNRMRSISTALSRSSASMGCFLSSVLVTITNSMSGRFGREWLGRNDLNHARLDLYYTVLCILNLANLLNYIYWAKKY